MKNLLQASLVLVFSFLMIYSHIYFDRSPEGGIVHEELTSLQLETLDMTSEMTKLLITLTTALIGLLGYLVIAGIQNNKPFNENMTTFCIISFMAAALSINFGYITLRNWAELLSINIFVPEDKIVVYPQYLQLIFFILSLISSCVIIIAMLNKLHKQIIK